ncbi:DUF3089 domain-containing protein [Sphingomonas sp. QA11]|uniref:DUF3089 domain-containing protein n=1 Tax=Sphingomonas sp. QA11 TaxID=2950605 RepID=UPI00234AA10A|nr:DUF3089 domain-containing protein [Sphingomonas sp. QA11]WCM28515.1 DUF3089 domain-containing protein [Sphingomonas sp. QA11]
MSLFLLIAATAAQAPAPNDYRRPETWLCRPRRTDVCSGDMAATVIAVEGAIKADRPVTASQPRADCFYVYPTTSMDETMHSDMIPDRQEQGMVASQAAPLRDKCRIFAPIYRQVTLPALRAAMRKGVAPSAEDFALPYADVLAAWRDYLARDNGGRPFVLVGHSQGSAMLKRLLVEEIDGKPIQRRMLSAILPGVSVMVPYGKHVGGDLKATPLCRSGAETGCVLTWASYRDTNPPPANGLFGRSPLIGTSVAELEAGCTNPAKLEGGKAPLDPLLGFPWWRGGVAQFKQPAIWSAKGKSVPTRFVRMPGLLSAECTVRNGFSYLSVHVESGTATDLADTVIGTATVGDTDYPDWGFHVVDMAIVEGDLARLIGSQSAAWYRRHRLSGKVLP